MRLFQNFLQIFLKTKKITYGIHPTSSIHHSASNDEDVYIGPNVTIGESNHNQKGVFINANSAIGSNVVICQNTKIYSIIILEKLRLESTA